MLVIQYQLPSSLSILWQRLGRGARDPTIWAIGVLLVEKKYFNDEKARLQAAAERRRTNVRKRKHKALLLEESAKKARLDLPANDTQSGEIVKFSEATTPALPVVQRSSTSKKPRGRSSNVTETGLDLYINSHLNPKKEGENNQCRRAVINKYFKNPTKCKPVI